MPAWVNNRKLIVSILVGAGVLIILLGLYILYIKPQTVPDEGVSLGCFKMLPEEYCNSGVEIADYAGHSAIGFNVPVGTELKAPFDGVYYDASPGGYSHIRMKLEPNFSPADTFLVITAEHSPILGEGFVFSEGQTIATVEESPELLDEDTGSNLVIYTTEYYDIKELFE
jgi:hypothetical protein